MIALPIKKRVTAITNGWADSKPILVATEAEDHKKAKTIPAIVSLTLVAFNKIFLLRGANLLLAKLKKKF